MKCIDCSEDLEDVRNCSFKDCPLYHFRMGKRATDKGLQAKIQIKKHCLECCNGSTLERRLCPATKCPIWRYRNGTEETL